MREPNPYRLSDEAKEYLVKRFLKRESQTKKRLLAADFDELNVMKEVDSLYDGMDSDNRMEFRDLYIERYREMMQYLKKRFADDEIDDLVEMYLAGLLSEPNDVTHYTYDTEVYRKRDRAKEAVISVPSGVLKQIELDKALRGWTAMTGWYLDIVSDDANVQAMKDAGIRRVRWVTQKDDRVCEDCKEKNDKIYPIDKIPVKPHVGCRCYVVPVRGNE